MPLSGTRARSLIGAVTAGLLIASVGLRLVQDSSLFRDVGPLSDPIVAALIIVEVVPLLTGALLGIAIGLIAWLTWTGRLQTQRPAIVVYCLILLCGLLVVSRASAPGFLIGWVLMVLSGAGLLTQYRFRKPPVQIG